MSDLTEITPNNIPHKFFIVIGTIINNLAYLKRLYNENNKYLLEYFSLLKGKKKGHNTSNEVTIVTFFYSSLNPKHFNPGSPRTQARLYVPFH